MDKNMFVMLMEDVNPLNSDVVARHVEHLRRLDHAGALVLCGPFSDYRGGMVVLRSVSCEEAELVAKADPFVAEGYKTYRLHTLEVATNDNGYLLG